MENTIKEKITVYTTSEFMGNVQRYEGTLIEQGRMEYAQYENAPFVSFVPKGKRNGIRIVKGYNPYILILKGWNHPEPEDMFGNSKGAYKDGVTIKESKYKSFDDGYKIDFNKVIDEYISNNTEALLADYRETIRI